MPDAEGRPCRIQLRRQKGWRLPPGAVSVARPTKWGNVYRTDSPPPLWPAGHPWGRAEAVECFEAMLSGGFLLRKPPGYALMQAAVRELAGKDLACWCGAGPCHASVLLRFANAELGTSYHPVLRDPAEWAISLTDA